MRSSVSRLVFVVCFVLVAVLALPAAGCKSDSAAGEKMEQMGDEAGEVAADVGDKAGDLAEEAKPVGQKIGEKAQKLGDEAVELGKEIGRKGEELIDETREAINKGTD
jgi:hypothetical protein